MVLELAVSVEMGRKTELRVLVRIKSTKIQHLIREGSWICSGGYWEPGEVLIEIEKPDRKVGLRVKNSKLK